MSKIQKLPDHIVNQIAAGEVIDRPYSIVKELVENSIDAGATQILVQYEAGGKESIMVADNGSGMDNDDAHNCFGRHATSKLTTLGDFDTLRTMGFRGEAIPSIASVSRFTLRTIAHGATTGVELTMDHGQVVMDKVVAGTPGTTITVQHLFAQLPARRKFISSDATEAGHIQALLEKYAIAYPKIRWEVYQNKRCLWRLLPQWDMEARVQELYPDLVRGKMYRQSDALQMYVSPTAARTRQDCVVLLNSRPIFNDAIFQAVRTGLSLAEKAPYPTFFLSLQIDPALFDVNVHPTKKQVKFENIAPITQSIIQLLQPTQVPTLSVLQPIQRILPEIILPIHTAVPSSHLQEIAPLPVIKGNTPKLDALPVIQPVTPAINLAEKSTPLVLQSTPVVLRPIGWFKGNVYLLEHPDGLLLADIERIQRYLFTINDREITTYLSPIPIEIAPKWKSILLDNLPVLHSVGIDLEEFGTRTLRILTFPKLLADVDFVALLSLLAQAVQTNAALLPVLAQNLPYTKPMQPHQCVQEVFGTSSSVFGRHYWLMPTRETIR